ncbi:DUF4097 family beta strand repeat-containing protein [Salinithrix halophila]|uniref:DUF4097 domain-containing protein n=1 Tax=Salinithrix halophila TaxID=1485204 RepID=A0ABV8JFK5_9BACL
MRKWRVGSFSAGLLLVLLGSILLANSLWHVSVLQWIVNGWPVILILLGVEVLIYQTTRREEKLRYDIVSISIMILVVLVSLVMIPVHSLGLAEAIRGAQTSTSINQSMKIPDHIKEVSIDVPYSNVDIQGTEENTLHVDGTLPLAKKKDLRQILTLEVRGDRAVLKVNKPNNPFQLFGERTSDLTVEVPRSLALSLKADVGDVTLSDLDRSTDVRLSSGNLTARNLKEKLTVDQDYGNVNLKKIRGEANVDTTSGDIHITDSTGPLALQTENGDIEIASDQVKGNWKAFSSQGDVKLSLPRSADATIEGKTSYGDLDGDWKKGKIVLGSGEKTIRLKTSTGNIQVQKR